MLLDRSKEIDLEEIQAIIDYERLRKEGQISTIILNDGGGYLRATNEIDPWGSAIPITKGEFIKLVKDGKERAA